MGKEGKTSQEEGHLVKSIRVDFTAQVCNWRGENGPLILETENLKRMTEKRSLSKNNDRIYDSVHVELPLLWFRHPNH